MEFPDAWQHMKQNDRGKYLWYLIGVGVTADEIFSGAYRKALAAVERFRGVFGGGASPEFHSQRLCSFNHVLPLAV